MSDFITTTSVWLENTTQTYVVEVILEHGDDAIKAALEPDAVRRIAAQLVRSAEEAEEFRRTQHTAGIA